MMNGAFHYAFGFQETTFSGYFSAEIRMPSNICLILFISKYQFAFSRFDSSLLQQEAAWQE